MWIYYDQLSLLHVSAVYCGIFREVFFGGILHSTLERRLASTKCVTFFGIWTGHSAYGRDIQHMDGTFSMWTGHSPYGRDIHHMDGTFSIWTGHSACGRDIQHVDGTFSLWAGHSAFNIQHSTFNIQHK
jgi:hypothetical protein